MQAIKVSFQSKIRTEIENAISVFIVFRGFGAASFLKQTSQTPEARAQVGAGDPANPSTRTIKFAPLHQQTADLIARTPDVTNEGFLSNIIQHWFDFLEGLYSDELQRALSGQQTGLKSIAVRRLNLETYTNSSHDQAVIEAAIEHFSRGSDAREKLDIVQKCLKRHVTADVLPQQQRDFRWGI